MSAPKKKWSLDEMDTGAGDGEKMTGHEIRCEEIMILLNATLIKEGDYLEERIRGDKVYPRLWNEFQLLRAYLNKIANRVGRLGNEGDLRHFELMRELGTVNITMKRAVSVPQHYYVEGKYIDQLVSVCMSEKCTMCMPDKHTVRNCKLRKALQNIVPAYDKPPKDECEFNNITGSAEFNWAEGR